MLANLEARSLALIDKEKAKEVVKESTLELLRISRPSYWNVYVSNNAIVENENAQGLMLLSMEEHTNKNVRDLSIMNFYHLKNWIKVKNKKNG